MAKVPHQLTPDVTAADISRVVRRDFAEDQVGEAMSVLNQYGTEKWHRERCRVQLAALKLASGSLRRLQYAIEDAKRDYRDVLGTAEYPGYLKETSIVARPGPDAKELQQIIDDDWAQYEKWLKKGK